MGRAIMPASTLLAAVVLSFAGACGGPQVPAVVSPSPCRVDEQGTVVLDGGVEAMCCPKDYIAGGNSDTNCPKGQCCPLTNEVNGRGASPPYGAQPHAGAPATP